MTTCRQLIDICRDRYLLAGLREQRNQLLANYTAGQTSLTFTYDLKAIQAGALIQVDQELFYVWSSDATSKTAVVSGAQQGTTSANHNANAVVIVNPRFADQAIWDALNEDLYDLASQGLFAVKQTEFAYNPARIGYDLVGVTNLTSILEVRYETNDQFKGTPRISPKDWRLERSYLGSENTSTYSLKLFRGGVPGRNVTVIYKAALGQFAALTDTTTTVGLSTSAADLPAVGAAIRLMAGKEVRRNQTESQGDTRRAEEVGPGAVAASTRNLMMMRAERLQAELNALAAAYPAERL